MGDLDQREVFSLLSYGEPFSVKEIVEETGLPIARVQNAIRNLKEQMKIWERTDTTPSTFQRVM